jgi:signal transduction histidine kinase
MEVIVNVSGLLPPPRTRTSMESLINPLVAQLTHHPFPQLAEALRASANAVTLAWVAVVRLAIPRMAGLTHEELQDSTPTILLAIADAMASGDPDEIRGVLSRSPMQGLSRFRLNLDVIDILQEDRLLRSLTVEHVETHLGRQLDPPESAALQAAVDVMVQQSVLAIVDGQKVQLRAAAEMELKYLAFLNHDLNNNLNGISLWLELLQKQLLEDGGFERFRDGISTARGAIKETMGGMRQMLSRARLHKSGEARPLVPVELRAAALAVAGRFAIEAQRRGIEVAVEVDAGVVVETDGELLALILQNLIGNAVKYASTGTVRIGCDLQPPRGALTSSPATVPAPTKPTAELWVSDEGPGIGPEMSAKIFEAFQRGTGHSEDGIGLGLTIASEAAKLLNADLTVASEVGRGSTFRLALGHDHSRRTR